MNGLDYWAVAATILILVFGLLALFLVVLAVRRSLAVFGLGYIGRHKNKKLAWLSLIFIIMGAIFGLLFTLGGGPNGAHTAAAYDGYIEAVFSAGLLTTGVVLTFFIRLPRPKRDEKLNQKIVQHSKVAWPWRHKWIFAPAALLVLLIGIFIYHELANQQSNTANIQNDLPVGSSCATTNECNINE